jgi:multiple sugar transport system permease protein
MMTPAQPGGGTEHVHDRVSRSRGSLPVQVLISGFLFIMALYFLSPVWWLLVSSTKSSSQLFSSFGFWLAGHNAFVANLRQLLHYQGGIFFRWMLNSAIYAGLGSGVATLLACAAGFVFAKYSFRGRKSLFRLVLAGVLVPPSLLALPLYLLFNSVHAVNTFWSVFLPTLVSPFGVYLARIYAQAGVPNELIDAARIDGSSEVRIFRSVAFRLMAPAVVTIFLFQFVAIWNNFLLPLMMLNNEHLFPVTLGLYVLNGLTSEAGAPPNVVALVVVGALISVIPLVVAFLLLQRYWRGGISVGAIQG